MFANNPVFNIVKGSTSVKVCMVVIEVIIIVAMYASYGWYLRPLNDIQRSSLPRSADEETPPRGS